MADLFRAYIPASVRVFVNVDAHQALDPAIIEGLLAIPGRDRLVVEWTERISPAIHVTRTWEASARAFEPLTKAGLALAIDDVGSGYDGIGRALQVRPAFAKLDMSLTHLARRVDPRFLRDLHALFEGIGAVVIAEGIESHGDLERIRAAGIRYGQGYYFKRGMGRTSMTDALDVS
jgi:EAL domain-containing protein (putative c-di-GMP-specific phosphodiesterase class I)